LPSTLALLNAKKKNNNTKGKSVVDKLRKYRASYKSKGKG